LDEHLLSGRVGLIYKELVGKAGLSLAADGCRVRGTLAKPGGYFRKEARKPIASYGSYGVWATCIIFLFDGAYHVGMLLLLSHFEGVKGHEKQLKDYLR
jgi:hypothetical protein